MRNQHLILQGRWGSTFQLQEHGRGTYSKVSIDLVQPSVGVRDLVLVLHGIRYEELCEAPYCEVSGQLIEYWCSHEPVRKEALGGPGILRRDL